MTPDAITGLWHLLGRLRAWWHRNCTPAGRRAMARRQRERELRAAGVSRAVAKIAAQRMTTGSVEPAHYGVRDNEAALAHNLSYREQGEPVHTVRETRPLGDPAIKTPRGRRRPRR